MSKTPDKMKTKSLPLKSLPFKLLENNTDWKTKGAYDHLKSYCLKVVSMAALSTISGEPAPGIFSDHKNWLFQVGGFHDHCSQTH